MTSAPLPILTPEEQRLSAEANMEHDLLFRNEWLRVALPADEYSKAITVSTDILAQLYPGVYQEGPNGLKWDNACLSLAAILDSIYNRKASPEQEALWEEFVELYSTDFQVDTLGDAAYNFANDNHRTGNYWVDTLSYVYDPHSAFPYCKLISHPALVDEYRMEDIEKAAVRNKTGRTRKHYIVTPGYKCFDRFSTLTLMEDFLANKADTEPLIGKHAAFMCRVIQSHG